MSQSSLKLTLNDDASSLKPAPMYSGQLMEDQEEVEMSPIQSAQRRRSAEDSVTESMWDSMSWLEEEDRAVGSPVASSTPHSPAGVMDLMEDDQQCAQGSPTDSQMASIFEWASVNLRPSTPPAVVPDTAPDLSAANILAYHPAMKCHRCQHRVRVDKDQYVTITYPCNTHKPGNLN